MTKTIFQLKEDLKRFSSGRSMLDKLLGLGQTIRLGLGYNRTGEDPSSSETVFGARLVRCGLGRGADRVDTRHVVIGRSGLQSATRSATRGARGWARCGRDTWLSGARQAACVGRFGHPNLSLEAESWAVWIAIDGALLHHF